MLLLVNTNRMRPPIGPIGLDYVAAAAAKAGVPTEVLDLCLAEDPLAALKKRLATAAGPRLIGLTFRNVEDCMWPSESWFVPELAATVGAIHELSDAPVVLGGAGFSILAGRIVEYTGADFGIRGDGELAVAELYRQVTGRRQLEQVPGLIWRADDGGWHGHPPCRSAVTMLQTSEHGHRTNSVRMAMPPGLLANAPAWSNESVLANPRDTIDNAAYFRLGGQGGFETKRGCPRQCSYCADRLAKGAAARLRAPADVADEVEALLKQGVDVLHTCDAEFNVPALHALAVCEEFIRRGLGDRVRWYAYMAVTPFSPELAGKMRRAGCVGIDFTGDSACPEMLAVYGHPHGPADLEQAVRLCRQNGIATMIDLLLGGPGETPETARRTIEFLKGIGPDCVGTALGVRICPDTPMADGIADEGPMEANPAIRRHYAGPVDLLRPTFYISSALGQRPAALINEFIAGDRRFFEPSDDSRLDAASYNYNDNTPLARAIAAGARGAYWHILRRLRA